MELLNKAHKQGTTDYETVTMTNNYAKSWLIKKKIPNMMPHYLKSRGRLPLACSYLYQKYPDLNNFTFDKLDESQKCINKLRELKRRLNLVHKEKKKPVKNNLVDEMLVRFSEKLGDDNIFETKINHHVYIMSV